jgi:endonuclease/exonuclease/phosphatase family metal-dependent hydrolase
MKLALLLAASIIMGCISQSPEANDSNFQPDMTNQTPLANQSNETAPLLTPTSNSTLRIASFNIQIFGESKRSKPEVMAILAKTAREFDILLVQELRDSTETTLPIYLEQINAIPGPKYAAVSSPRLGRTSSKENYAYLFNTETVELLSNYTFTDPPEGSATDIFQREPFLARFRPKGGNFDFVLIGIHTDPEEARQEITDLPLVIDDASGNFPEEKDFIILGDLNADCNYFRPDEYVALKNASYFWIIPDSADTTTKSTNCTYDRIIATSSATGDYAGTWGVFRFDTEYGLNQSFTEQVSDHYPVWADFFASNDSD